MINVYFDENTSRYIADAINKLESGEGKISVHHTLEVFGKQGVPDEDIVRMVHDNSGVLFSQDADFVKAQQIVEAIKQYPIGLFYLKQKSMSYWKLVNIYVKAWTQAREEIIKGRIPYYFEIMPNGKIKKRPL